MASTAADLVDHVLPEAAPLRQWVLTLPFELRARLAFDGKLLGAVCRTFVDSVVDWYRLKRTFKMDVERCDHCGARMQLWRRQRLVGRNLDARRAERG